MLEYLALYFVLRAVALLGCLYLHKTCEWPWLAPFLFTCILIPIYGGLLVTVISVLLVTKFVFDTLAGSKKDGI